MARKNGKSTMISDGVIRRIIGTYPDCITTDDEGNLEYEESCYRVAETMMETMPETQIKSVFGFVFKDFRSCYDYIYKKIPGLCEAMIEFTQSDDYNPQEDEE